VYVHCWGGFGRTGTVVGCHLVRHGRSGAAALARLNELRRETPYAAHPSPEREAQRALVRSWE
jgi:protein-tyrosine phosphatase